MPVCHSMRPRFVAGLSFIIAAIVATWAASAGPLRAALMARHDAQAQADGGLPGVAGDRGSAQIPSDIKVTRDVAYGSAPGQRLDVYALTAAKEAPVIVMVHGGAWMFGKRTARTVVQNKIAHWVPKGFVFVSVDYRMVPEVEVSDEAQDVASALAFVQQHAGQWGGDGHRVVLMGHSAGAHLVALLSASPAVTQAQGVQPWLGTIALDSAAYDVSAIMRRRHYRFYDRAFGSDPRVWAADSPTTQLTTRSVPFLGVCSSQREDSCPATREFVAKAIALGTRAQVLPADKTHEQINDTLGEDPAYTVAVDAFLSRLDPGIAHMLSR